MREFNIRAKLDLRNEKMGAKIRKSEMDKIPIMFILGENEQKNNSVSVRRRFEGNLGEIKFDEYLDSIKEEINKKSRRYLK